MQSRDEGMVYELVVSAERQEFLLDCSRQLVLVLIEFQLLYLLSSFMLKSCVCVLVACQTALL